MSKLSIRNHAEPKWSHVIESQARYRLGSIPANSRRIMIELNREPGDHELFTCKFTVILDNGERYALENTQPKAELAIDGVLARARRVIARRVLGRVREEEALVSEEKAGCAQLR